MSSENHLQEAKPKPSNLRQLAEQLLYEPGAIDQLSEALGGTLEGFGKLLVALAGVAYAIGVFIAGLYHASFSIRYIEWLQLQYIFIGIAYMLFAYFALIFPLKHLSRMASRVKYFLTLSIICFCSWELLNYIWFRVGNPDFTFPQRYGFQLLYPLCVGLITTPLAFGAFWFSKNSVGSLRSYRLLLVGFLLLLLMYTFATSIFPWIPQSLGGGSLPVAHVVFAERAPLEMTEAFEILRPAEEPVAFRHYARVLHADSNSIVLVQAPWFSDQAIEVDRSMVVAMEFGVWNPAEAIQLKYDD